VQAKRSGNWLRALQLLMTIGLMAWLLRQIEWPSIRLLLTNARWSLVILSIGGLCLSHLINIVRWRYLLDQRQVGFGTLLVFYGVGLFSNNFLPTGIGGDGVRVALLSRQVPLGRAMFSVVLDRGIGLIALSALFVLGLWGGLPPDLDFGISRRLGVFIGWNGLTLFLVVLAALLVAGLLAWQCWPAARARILDLLARRTAAWDVPRWGVLQWLQHLVGAYLLSVGSHIGTVAAIWAALGAMRVDLPPGAAIWLVVISSMSLLLPIAVNGIGVVESVYVIVLSSYAVAPSVGLSVALVVRVIGLLVSLAGGVLMLNRRVLAVESRSKQDRPQHIS
jgi:glycosyltransferase 2 family protein